MTLVGEVAGKTAILVDDMADTCGTLVKAASVLIDQGGAKDAIAIVTHGILSGNAIEALNGSRLKKIVVTNTVPHEAKKEVCDRIETIDISPTVSGEASSSIKTASDQFSLPRRADVPITARACLSSSSTRPLIKSGIPHTSICFHSLLAFRSMGQIYIATLPISGYLDESNKLLHTQIAIFHRMVKPLLLKKTRKPSHYACTSDCEFPNFIFTRLWQCNNPLSKSATLLGKSTHVLKCANALKSVSALSVDRSKFISLSNQITKR
jgi:hypothetical protein